LYCQSLLIPVSVPEILLSSEEDMTSVYLFLGRSDGKILEGHETFCGLHPGQRGKKLSAGLG
jgi:hypothetical protein